MALSIRMYINGNLREISVIINQHSSKWPVEQITCTIVLPVKGHGIGCKKAAPFKSYKFIRSTVPTKVMLLAFQQLIIRQQVINNCISLFNPYKEMKMIGQKAPAKCINKRL